ncbi:MAG: LTA synthase family protein [Christensenellales bacterium]
MKEKLLKFFKINYIPFLFAAVAILLELTAVLVTSGKFYIIRPWMYLTILGFLTAVQFFIPNNTARHVFSSFALAAFFIVDLIFIVIFDMTGKGNVFDFSMLNLGGEAMDMIEKLQINFIFVSVGGILVSAFIVFGHMPIDKMEKPDVTKTTKIALPCVLALIVGLHSVAAALTVAGAEERPLSDKLYGYADSLYSDEGVIGNFASELYKGAFRKKPTVDLDEMDDFIYAEVSRPTERFGRASGYNVVTVLCESFEWFAFMKDEKMFPGGYKVSEDILRELYPNLYEFYDSAVVMTNFHSREKTDISENLSIIGNYPLDYYINFDYDENNIAYSLPNVMKNLYGVESESFHNGTRNFYNRSDYLTGAAGFKSFVPSEDMEALYGMPNYTSKGERNLDSDMIEACKQRMFPSDRRFNTYITTITMHGQYSYRENLEKYYAIMDEYGILPLSDGLDAASVNNNTFRYYAAAAMELDRAVGAMTAYLKENGLEDNTVIALFGDHNAFYQSLPNIVKGIYPGEPGKNTTDLYRVPFMLKIGSGEESTVKIDKFTCTADILPTLLDLLGIRYFSNIYYGTSVFSDEESILYSRAYDVFMTDKIYFTTLNNIKYAAPEVDEAYMNEIEDRALILLDKISHVNKMFASDFFRGDRLEKFNSKMLEINGM